MLNVVKDFTGLVYIIRGRIITQWVSVGWRTTEMSVQEGRSLRIRRTNDMNENLMWVHLGKLKKLWPDAHGWGQHLTKTYAWYRWLAAALFCVRSICMPVILDDATVLRVSPPAPTLSYFPIIYKNPSKVLVNVFLFTIEICRWKLFQK